MRQAFVDYVERMKQVRSLSTPSLDSISTANDYSRVLLENFKRIGLLAKENREVVEKELLPLLNSKERLSEEEIQELNELNEYLFDMASKEEIDQHIADLINERLFKEELSSAEPDSFDERMIQGLIKTMQIKYFLMVITSNRNFEASEKYREEGIEATRKLKAYLEKDEFSKLSPEMQDKVFRNCISGVLLYERNRGNSDLEFARKSVEYLKHELELMGDPFYEEVVGENRNNFEFMIYYYFGSLAEAADLPKDMATEIYEYASRMLDIWKSNEEACEKFYRDMNFASLQAQVLKVAVCAQHPALWRLYGELHEAYLKRDVSSYNEIGFKMNLGVPGSLYMVLARKEKSGLELTEREIGQMEDYVRNMLAYLHHVPKSGGLMNCVMEFEGLLDEYQEFPGQLSFEELCIQTMAAVHPPTYVHSNMVAKITECLVRNLIRIRPQLFADFPGVESPEEVVSSKDQILEYAYHASLCHDLGKTMIIDTIGMYGRQLLDSEYYDLKQHPGNGARLASRHKSTSKYVDVILGHHLWYDGSKGYPLDFDASKSPYKVIIDLVTAADCLDAATDSVGRSYNKGKSLEEFEKELADGAGTRYAPYLPALFADPMVHADLEFLLSEERSKLYRETFHLLRQMTR